MKSKRSPLKNARTKTRNAALKERNKKMMEEQASSRPLASEQLRRLDVRLGKNIGASRERKKLKEQAAKEV